MSAKREQRADDKPRADAKLKTLPAERQAVVYERLCQPAPAGTLEAVRDWLRADGVETSIAALSEFRRWYRFQLQFSRAGDFTQQVIESIKEQQPGLSEAALESYAQTVFQARALELEATDPIGAAEMWDRMQRLKLKGREQDLERMKFQRETCRLFLSWNEDRRAQDIGASSASQSEKIERLGQLMFGEDWNADANAEPQKPAKATKISPK